jgi:hypothetical protein
MNKCIITFEDKNSQLHNLTYRLCNSSLANKWADMVLENQKFDDKYIHTTLYNVSGSQIPEIHEDIVNIIKNINAVYHIPLPLYEDCSVLNNEQLNHLHFMFEQHGDRIPELEAKNLHRRETQLMFLRLNELIHTYESALENTRNAFSNMTIMFDYYPQTIFQQIEPIDKMYVRNNFLWGELYLGYNTLGKDWLTAAGDNDIDLVKRGQVRPQQRYAAEAWLCFRKDEHPTGKLEHFEQWYNSLDDEIKSKVPIDQLSEMSLGKFIIGELLITDELLKFDPNVKNWKTLYSNTKNKWNNEVFSTFKKVKNIKIIR